MESSLESFLMSTIPATLNYPNEVFEIFKILPGTISHPHLDNLSLDKHLPANRKVSSIHR